MLNGIAMTFVYLYMRKALGASQLCISACVLVTVLVEVPIMFIGGKIVEKVRFALHTSIWSFYTRCVIVLGVHSPERRLTWKCAEK